MTKKHSSYLNAGKNMLDGTAFERATGYHEKHKKKGKAY